jgi:hypothetical protein
MYPGLEPGAVRSRDTEILLSHLPLVTERLGCPSHLREEWLPRLSHRLDTIKAPPTTAYSALLDRHSEFEYGGCGTPPIQIRNHCFSSMTPNG